jgi:DNA-binding NarL/FixJ family response regulator
METSEPNAKHPLTRILLVDDHALLRDAMRQLLEAEGDLEVIGEAGDSEQAVRIALELRPDMILLDVEIPGDDARTTVSRILHRLPRTAVIVVSMHAEPQIVRGLLDAGVRGYLLKTVSREDLMAAIRAARDHPDRVVLSLPAGSLVSRDGVSPGPLSSREVEVLRLVAQACSNFEIATELCITEGTVKQHLRRIFSKLGAVSRIDAVNKATAASILEPPQPPGVPGRWGTDEPRTR